MYSETLNMDISDNTMILSFTKTYPSCNSVIITGKVVEALSSFTMAWQRKTKLP